MSEDNKNIAVSATGGSIHGQVEERFGRAPYYVVVDPESGRFGLVSNPAVTAAHGAGPQTAAMLAERQVGTVLTGRVGPKARDALEALGIQIIEGASGKIRDVVNAHLARTGRRPLES